MKSEVYRVREVLAGHSSTMAVIAVDQAGRELRLEVGALDGASIHAGELLLINWQTIVVPQFTQQPAAVAGMIEDEEEPLLGRSAESLGLEVETETRSETPSSETMEKLRALIGMQ